MVQMLIGAVSLSIRALAPRAGRDVKRVHDSVAVLAELGRIERTDQGVVLCSFTDPHVDMYIGKASQAAASDLRDVQLRWQFAVPRPCRILGSEFRKWLQTMRRLGK